MWDLVPWPGRNPGPGPPALGAHSLSHWTARGSQQCHILILDFFKMVLMFKVLWRRIWWYLEKLHVYLICIPLLGMYFNDTLTKLYTRLQQIKFLSSLPSTHNSSMASSWVQQFFIFDVGLDLEASFEMMPCQWKWQCARPKARL